MQRLKPLQGKVTLRAEFPGVLSSAALVGFCGAQRPGKHRAQILQTPCWGCLQNPQLEPETEMILPPWMGELLHIPNMLVSTRPLIKKLFENGQIFS